MRAVIFCSMKRKFSLSEHLVSTYYVQGAMLGTGVQRWNGRGPCHTPATELLCWQLPRPAPRDRGGNGGSQVLPSRCPNTVSLRGSWSRGRQAARPGGSDGERPRFPDRRSHDGKRRLRTCSGMWNSSFLSPQPWHRGDDQSGPEAVTARSRVPLGPLPKWPASPSSLTHW